jgi:nitroreductase
MDVIEACRTRRTVRQFLPKPVPFNVLEKCVDAARLAPSARNLQVLEYVVVDSEGPLDKMFKCMGFGGDVDSFDGKEPRAYIAILINKDIPSNWDKHDSGMATENIMLAAWEQGIGSCALAKINRKGIMELLAIPERYEVDLVVALGYPAEQPVTVEASGGDTQYYRDGKGRLHIPKRRLADMLHRNGF